MNPNDNITLKNLKYTFSRILGLIVFCFLFWKGCGYLMTYEQILYEKDDAIDYEKRWLIDKTEFPNHYINDCFIVIRLLPESKKDSKKQEKFELFFSLVSRTEGVKGKLFNIVAKSSLNRKIKIQPEFQPTDFELLKQDTEKEYHWYFSRKGFLILAPKRDEKVRICLKLRVTKEGKTETKELCFQFNPEFHRYPRLSV